MVEYVQRLLGRGVGPTKKDLVAALNDIPKDAPLPQPLRAFIEGRLPVKRGPKGRTVTTREIGEIVSFHVFAMNVYGYLHEKDGTPKTRPVKRRADVLTAKVFGLSRRTIEDLVAPIPLLKSPPK